MTAEKTDWKRLRNPDRAQVASLGAAGPAAGASVDLDQLAAEIVERAEAYSLDGFALKGRNELRAFVAERLRRIVTVPTPTASGLNLNELTRLEQAATPGQWQVVDYEDEDGDGRRYIGMKDIGHGWWDADSTMLTAEDAAFISAIRNAAPALIAAAGEGQWANHYHAAWQREQSRADDLVSAIHGWVEADTTWEGEQRLYEDVLRLAGIEPGTPAGPPVAAAGTSGLDVERLVEALTHLMDTGQIVDPALRGAFIYGLDGVRGSGMRALVLAALGLDESTTTRDVVAQRPDESEVR